MNGSATGLDLLMTKVRAAQVLLAARRYFDEGRFAIAELALRDYPADCPQQAEAADLRGRALLALNLPNHAADAFQDALVADANFTPALERLPVAAKLGLHLPLSTSPRYLIIREWMEGFWSDVDHVIGACLVAETAGRIPIVHWGAQSRYGSRSGDNAWTKFFQPVAAAALDDARAVGKSFYPPKWSAENLDGNITSRGTGPNACSCSLDLLGRSDTCRSRSGCRQVR